MNPGGTRCNELHTQLGKNRVHMLLSSKFTYAAASNLVSSPALNPTPSHPSLVSFASTRTRVSISNATSAWPALVCCAALWLSVTSGLVVAAKMEPKIQYPHALSFIGLVVSAQSQVSSLWKPRVQAAPEAAKEDVMPS